MAKKQKIWVDETGLEIPASRITPVEKKKEAVCEKLLSKGQKLSDALSEFKEEISNAANEILNDSIAANGGTVRDNYKGNFTFYNFDRSIKIETASQDKIVFDDAMIIVAKQHFDTFLQDATSTGGVDEMIRDLILDAFSTARGKLDTDKVLGLTKYRSRIEIEKYPSFHSALDAIEKGINRQFSKKYHRISIRINDEYVPVNLNFSSL
jgi:hypothetical protein